MIKENTPNKGTLIEQVQRPKKIEFLVMTEPCEIFARMSEKNYLFGKKI